MSTTTKTIAYVLSVPAASLPGEHTPGSACDFLVEGIARIQADLGDWAVELTGSHVNAHAGAVRFRVASDVIATEVATSIVGDAAGAQLHSGFGVNKRLVATN